MTPILTPFEIDFFESLLKKNPNFVDALSVLAEAYTAAGLYEKGLGMDQRLSELCPKDGYVFYNLGCSYALLNRAAEAIEALEKAARLGYRDWKYMQRDADLAMLAGHPRFVELLQHMRSAAGAGLAKKEDSSE